MNTSLEKISTLLQQAEVRVAQNKAARKEAYLRGEAFNVFHTCGVNHYENTHSAILAEWLNPCGSHGQGDLFLKHFIRSLSLMDSSRFSDGFETGRATISTEYATDAGRFDILIEDHAGKAIILENKIFALDQHEQLKRYDRYARENYGKNNYLLVYLTLDGSGASEQSGEGVDYLCISYGKTITAWLEDCVKSVYDKPFLRETMIQYKNLIEQLTGQNMEKSIEKELVEEMLKYPGAVAAIVNSSSAMEQILIEESLFNPLREFAKKNNLSFMVPKTFWEKRAWGYFYFEVKPGLQIEFQHERAGWSSFYFGIIDTRQDRPERKKLPGLMGGNDSWPYGWHYFDKHINWTIDDIVEFSHDGGEFMRYITGAVESLVKTMKTNGII